ncbi:hypothetical protein QUF74_00555 [Candidatus Halobeggiatoa sp. HSG11]|nr:hypothetical protein [Candidatus Halobeggiatoa sp. HSG11]
MTKLVKFKIDEGNFEIGFKVSVQVGEEGELYDSEFKGYLPPAVNIPNDYESWQENYLKLSNSWCGGPIVGRAGNINDERGTLIQLAIDSAKDFHSNFVNWLNTENDKKFQSLKKKLYQKLGDKNTEIRFIIQTDDPVLKKLPWHIWDLFTEEYTNAEVAIGANEFDRPPIIPISNQLGSGLEL